MFYIVRVITNNVRGHTAGFTGKIWIDMKRTSSTDASFFINLVESIKTSKPNVDFRGQPRKQASVSAIFRFSGKHPELTSADYISPDSDFGELQILYIKRTERETDLCVNFLSL